MKPTQETNHSPCGVRVRAYTGASSMFTQLLSCVMEGGDFRENVRRGLKWRPVVTPVLWLVWEINLPWSICKVLAVLTWPSKSEAPARLLHQCLGGPGNPWAQWLGLLKQMQACHAPEKGLLTQGRENSWNPRRDAFKSGLCQPAALCSGFPTPCPQSTWSHHWRPGQGRGCSTEASAMHTHRGNSAWRVRLREELNKIKKRNLVYAMPFQGNFYSCWEDLITVRVLVIGR